MSVTPGILVGTMNGEVSADAGTIVSDQIAAFVTRVETYVADAESVIDSIRVELSNGGASQITYTPSMAGVTVAYTEPAAVTLADASFTAITIPAPPSLDAVDATLATVGAKPIFNDDVSGFVEPPTVAAFTYTFPTITDPGDAPTTTDPTVPDAPTLVDPTLPTFTAIVIPTLPTITMPTWTRAALSPFAEAAPAGTLNYVENSYSSIVLQECRDSLASYASIQAGIWSKALDRETATWKRGIDEAARFGATGFSFPTGAAAARVLQAAQDSSLKISDLNRDAAIEQAKLAMQHLQAILGLMVQQDGQLMSYWTAQQNRLLDFAKAELQALIDVFNIKVAAYNANVAGLNADVAVFQAEIQVEMSKLEATKIELESQKLIGETNNQLLQLYQGQLQALQTKQAIYNGQLEGVKIQADLQRQKIELYREKVNVFVAKSKNEIEKLQLSIEAKKVEYQGVDSHLRSQEIQAGLVKTGADVFAAKMGGYRTDVEMARSKAETVIAKNANLIENFRATMDWAGKTIDYELGKVKAVLENNASKVEYFKADTVNKSQKMTKDVETAKIEIAEMQANVDVAKAQASMFTEASIRGAQIAVEALVQIKAMYGQLAASSLNAVNLSAGLTESMQYGLSASSGYDIPQPTNP